MQPILQGLAQLPSKEDMWEDIATKRKAMAMRYKKSMRHTIQVDYVKFMDELAEIIGCKPNISTWFSMLKDVCSNFQFYTMMNFTCAPLI